MTSIRKNALLWVLYDFANSIVSIVFFLYFAQWVVVDMKRADILFNLTFTASALMLLITVPIFGVLLDRGLSRLKGLRWSTLSTVVFYLATFIFALLGNVPAALITFTVGLFSYLAAFTFYTPLISQISTKENIGRISGYGIAANYLGGFLGLLIALPFSKGSITLFGGLPRVEALFPAIVLFFIATLPTLIFFRENRGQAGDTQNGQQKISHPENSHTNIFKEAFSKLKTLFKIRIVALFLISYFLFNDAILTASNNFPIFLEQVWSISDEAKTWLLVGVMVTSALGGLIAGFISDRFGHKKTLAVILFGWAIVFPALGFVPVFGLFVAAVIMMGLWFGATWTVSRSVMADLAPKEQYNLAFGCFNLVERVSSFVGPLIWGLVVNGLFTDGSFRYRIAILAVTAFVLAGLAVLLRTDRVR